MATKDAGQTRKARDNDGSDPGSPSGKKLSLDSVSLRRAGLPARREADAAALVKKQAESVSAGPIDRVIELAFNPSREKLREVTIIDRMQGRTFPLIDTMSSLFLDCVKVAAYRQSPIGYAKTFEEPHPPELFDIMGEYLYRAAQWQKSIAGKNLERATDIALAETEKGTEDEDQYTAGRGYED